MPEVTIGPEGFVVDAGLIAGAFDLEPAAVPGLMRQGAISGITETGVGEDAGRYRLTLYHAGRALRLTIDEHGTVLSRATFPAHPPRPGGG
jgi:hypothetical protein